MLLEALLTLTARTSRPLRRAGLVGDAVALWSRATRRAADWTPHEERSRALVARAVAAIGHGRTAVVLGSGLLRDVPVDLLCERFDRVVLVDAVHLWPARRRGRAPHVERRVIDLTRDTSGGRDGLALLKADPSVDFVVSACVLSQLAHAPTRRVGAAGDLATRIVRQHLDDLAAFAARVCLVTDVAYEVVRSDGSAEERHDLLAGIALPPPDESWTWTVAPPGEIERRRAYVHRVHGYSDFRWP